MQKGKTKRTRKVMVVDARSTRGGFEAAYNVTHRVSGGMNSQAATVGAFGHGKVARLAALGPTANGTGLTAPSPMRKIKR